MDRELHRLENLLFDRDRTIKQLRFSNAQLEKDLQSAKNELQNFKEKSHQYLYVPNHEVIQTLEAKIASASWQIVQLQRANLRYQNIIVELHNQILAQQHELELRKEQINNLAIGPEINFIEDSSIESLMDQWQRTLKQKELLAEQNSKLKQSINRKEIQMREKFQVYIKEVSNLAAIVKTNDENNLTKINQIEKLVSSLRKQNEQLRKHMKIKNQQILLFLDQSKLISTDKNTDIHTIKNLKFELRKKSQQFFKVLSKMKETEEIKERLLIVNKKYETSITELEKVSESYEKTKRENGQLKQKLKIQQEKSAQIQEIKKEANKKIYELLTENQACHQLLFQARGFNNLFTKDIQAKLVQFQAQMQKRKQYCDSWLDVTELIEMNQKLRNRMVSSSMCQ